MKTKTILACYAFISLFVEVGVASNFTFVSNDNRTDYGIVNISGNIVSRDGLEQQRKKLRHVVILWNFQEIQSHAFQNNGDLESIVILPGITKIGQEAFGQCVNLEKIWLPDTVKIIGTDAFIQCNNLKYFNIPDSVEVIEHGAFAGCPQIESFSFPNTIVDIQPGVLRQCKKLKTVTLPKYVVTISDYVFEGCCELSSIDIPTTVKKIGDHAFSDCSKLRKITIPSGVEKIAYNSFKDCSSLESIAIPDSVQEIEKNAFSGCSALEDVGIPAGRIGNHAFADCYNLKKVNLSKNISQIGDYAFYNCDLRELEICGESIEIGTSAFENNINLKKITINGDVHIKTNAFTGCTNLEEIVINGSARLEKHAFYKCSSLKRLLISEKLRTERNVFDGCRLLKNASIQNRDVDIYSFDRFKYKKFGTRHRFFLVETAEQPELDEYCAFFLNNCKEFDSDILEFNIERLHTKLYGDVYVFVYLVDAYCKNKNKHNEYVVKLLWGTDEKIVEKSVNFEIRRSERLRGFWEDNEKENIKNGFRFAPAITFCPVEDAGFGDHPVTYVGSLLMHKMPGCNLSDDSFENDPDREYWVYFNLGKGVGFLHKNQFYHGDLKGNNIIVGPGYVSIIDFGGADGRFLDCVVKRELI